MENYEKILEDLRNEEAKIQENIKKYEELKAIEEEQRKNIHEYETMIIVNPDVNIRELSNIMAKIKEYIKEPIKGIEHMGTKKLAYTIAGKYNEGYYLRFIWNGISLEVQEIEKYFRENDDIIKFISVKIGE